ncbi:MAG: hypothetical protein AAGF99_07390 [Bacteroidota bacterium]
MTLSTNPSAAPRSALGLALALLVSAPLFAGDVCAQDPVPLGGVGEVETHTLEIRGGALHLDGVQLAADAIPADLDLSGLSFVMQYSGSVAPVLTLNGTAYVFEDARLVRFEDVETADRGVQVYGLGEPDQAVSLRSGAASPPVVTGEQAYLMRLSEHDRRLYDLLQRERAMEAEALTLARRIQRTPDTDRRAQLVADLRVQLDAIFELKQEVRRAEVDQAATQLDAVRARLDERDTRRAAIVQERLRSLLGDLAD